MRPLQLGHERRGQRRLAFGRLRHRREVALVRAALDAAVAPRELARVHALGQVQFAALVLGGQHRERPVRGALVRVVQVLVSLRTVTRAWLAVVRVAFGQNAQRRALVGGRWQHAGMFVLFVG